MIERVEKIAACVVLCLLVLSLLPVIYLGRYNHPTGDDYYYGVETKEAWEQNGSLTAVFAEASKGVALQYKIWQGTYSAMFLMYIPPHIFGDWAYRLVTCAIILSLTGSVFYFLKSVICNYFKGSVSLWITVSSLLVLLCVETVPSQGETFFWYNGSMYYTGFYAVTIFFFGFLLRYLEKTQAWRIPLLAVLAAFLAGGNYVSLLPALILLACLTVYLAVRRSKCAWTMGITLFVMLAGLAVSVMAPGNAMRQSDMWKLPAWKAVLKSLLQGGRYLRAWTGIWLFLALFILTPFLWRAVSATSLRFRYPLLVIGFCYGIFCSMSCPTFYTMNSTGPARAVAVVYYGFILTIFVCYGYLLGYLHRIMEGKQLTIWPGIWKGLLAAGVLLLCVQLLRGSLWELTTGKAITLLANGEAAAYEREYQDRIKVLTDDRVQDVVFRPYEYQPDMLFVGDFSGDVMDETNLKVAQYFHKNTVRVEY